MKTKTIDIPIFLGQLTMVLVDNGWDEFDKEYNVKTKSSYEGVVVDNINSIIIGIENTSPSVIAHEAVHVVNAIFLGNGIKLSRTNDETQAYLTGWVVKEIDEFLKEQGKSNITAIEMMDALVNSEDKKGNRPNSPILLGLTEKQLDGLRSHYKKLGLHEELNRLDDYNLVKRLGYEFLVFK